MNKFVFVFIALAALAATACAKPNYGPVYAPPVVIPAPPPVAYVEIPTKSYAPSAGYGAAPGYAASPGYAPAPSVPSYQPIPLPPLTYGGGSSIVVPAPSNPSATATAASATVGLKPGNYKQLIIPSWAVLASGVETSNNYGPAASPY